MAEPSLHCRLFSNILASIHKVPETHTHTHTLSSLTTKTLLRPGGGRGNGP